MVQCEMCGKQANKTFDAIIEGAEMSVCSECLKMGKIKQKPLNKTPKTYFHKKKEPELEERIIANPGKEIKSAREKKGMRQQDLAKMMQIKDSYLHHIETGDISLPKHLAKKFEDALNIKLIKKFKHGETFEIESEKTSFTIADMIKKKTK